MLVLIELTSGLALPFIFFSPEALGHFWHVMSETVTEISALGFPLGTGHLAKHINTSSAPRREGGRGATVPTQVPGRQGYL